MLPSLARLARERLLAKQDQVHPRGREGVVAQVKTLIPIWVQRPLANGRRLCLLAVDRSNSKGVREACL